MDDVTMFDAIAQDLSGFITVVGVLVATVAWFIRLEMREKNNHDDVRNLQQKYRALYETMGDVKAMTDQDHETLLSLKAQVHELEQRSVSSIEKLARIETKIETFDKKIDVLISSLKKGG